METVNVRSHANLRVPLLAVLIVLVLLLGAFVAFTALANGSDGELMTQTLNEPLGAVTAAKIQIDPGDGHLTVNALTGSDTLLASGTLEYLERRGQPAWSVDTTSGQPVFSLKGTGGQTGFNLPWQACTGDTQWQIHLNPSAASDISAYTAGGNVALNLAGFTITQLSAETGGGNMDAILPDRAADLNTTLKTGGGNVTVDVGSGITGSHRLTASSGAGNVTVRIPAGIPARIHTTSGLGKVIVDPSFTPVDETTFQSPGYEGAPNRIEITLSSGAGNVSVTVR